VNDGGGGEEFMATFEKLGLRVIYRCKKVSSSFPTKGIPDAYFVTVDFPDPRGPMTSEGTNGELYVRLMMNTQ